MTISTPKLSDRTEYYREYRKNNRSKRQAADKARYHRDPSKQRNNTLKHRYGITAEQWDEMFDLQGKRCAICASDVPLSAKGWDLDHCHSSGAVRGILCHPCNVMLGGARDNPDILSKAIKYLN